MIRPSGPFYEPTPEYMKRLLLLGARFAEGNTNDTDGSTGESPEGSEEANETEGSDADNVDGDAGSDNSEDSGEDSDSDGDGDDGDGDSPEDDGDADEDEDEDDLGERGRNALKAERKARKTAEKNAREAVTRAEKAERELWTYKALSDYPVPKEHRHLVKGDTEAEVLAAAKSVAELISVRPGVVRVSGTSGEGTPVGTSVTSGRSLYREQTQSKSHRKEQSNA